jgi:hypothetical protein
VAKRGFIVLAMVALTCLVVALLAGEHPWAGPEVLEISDTHGLHLWDFPILGVWAALTWCGWWLWRREGQ